MYYYMFFRHYIPYEVIIFDCLFTFVDNPHDFHENLLVL